MTVKKRKKLLKRLKKFQTLSPDQKKKRLNRLKKMKKVNLEKKKRIRESLIKGRRDPRKLLRNKRRLKQRRLQRIKPVAPSDSTNTNADGTHP